MGIHISNFFSKSQFDLVCERGSWGFVSTSVIFAGFFVGSIVIGILSDKFGRKRPLFICGFFCWLFNLVSAFAPTFWFFALCRSIVGFMLGTLHLLLVACHCKCDSRAHEVIPGEGDLPA